MKHFDIQERNALVLSRFSVFDLREQADEDLSAAVEKLTAGVSVAERGVSENCIEWFVIESGAKLYEVRRFETFVFCSCEGFFYSGKACKHIAATFPAVCKSCRRYNVGQHGDECAFCEVRNAKYLKPTSGKIPERIGNVRI